MFRGIVGPSSVKVSSLIRQKREFWRLSVLPSKCSFRLLTSRASVDRSEIQKPIRETDGINTWANLCPRNNISTSTSAVPSSVGRRNETRIPNTFCSTSMALFLLEIDRKTHPRLRWSVACTRARERARARVRDRSIDIEWSVYRAA